MLKNIGLPELIIIILVLIVFFGSKKITELAKQAGETGRELKKVKKEYEKAKRGLDEDPGEEEEKSVDSRSQKEGKGV